jgi:hypothetical protein
MEDREKEIQEKIIDLKGTLESFIEEEKQEFSQNDEIKAYDDKTDTIIEKKKKKSSDEDDELEDEEHLKRLKKELLDSLERVDILAKKIFGEKEKDNLKNIKIKPEKQKSKDREQIIEQMREKVQKDQERSREE